MIGPAFMPARPPVLGASTGNTRIGAIAGTTVVGGGFNSPATREGSGACGWVWACGEASGLANDAETISPSPIGAAFGAEGCAGVEGCAAGFAAADKSAAFNMPLRLSASTRS